MTTTERPDWLRRMGSGYDHGDTLTAIYEGERYAAVKFPGHSYWSGVGARSYAQASYYVVEKGKKLSDAEELKELRGRLNKAGKAKLIARVQELDKAKA